MNTIVWVIIGAAVAGVAAFLIPLLIELRKTIATLRRTTEERLNPALDELQIVLKNVNGITGNVNEVTEDVKRLSKSVGEIGDTVSGINALVGSVGSSAAVRAVSFRAGVKAAAAYLVTHLMSRKKGVGDEG